MTGIQHRVEVWKSDILERQMEHEANHRAEHRDDLSHQPMTKERIG